MHPFPFLQTGVNNHCYGSVLRLFRYSQLSPGLEYLPPIHGNGQRSPKFQAFLVAAAARLLAPLPSRHLFAPSKNVVSVFAPEFNNIGMDIPERKSRL